MEAQRFRLVLGGELMEGYDRQEAIRSLAALFKLPPDRLGGVLAGKPIPLKQELELPRAQQIQARLHGLGVKCSIQPIGGASGLSLVDAPRPPDRNPTVAMTCPGCGHEQAMAAECRRCGVVLSKWKELKLEEQEERAVFGSPRDDELLQLFVDANAEKYLARFQRFRAARGYAFTWHWPALFVPVFWALYRKLWGWAAVMFLSMFVPLAFLVWPATANYIYYRHAQGELARLGKSPKEASVALAGGTSPKAVWIALAVCLLAGIGVGMMLKPRIDTANYYAHAAQETKARTPDTPQGKKTLMVLRATALLVNVWTASGKDLERISIEDLAADLQQPLEPFQDGWGNLVRVAPTAEGFVVLSAGPDALFGSEDDVSFEPPLRR